MKLISLLHVRSEEGIFISQRNYLWRAAGGLKENILEKTGCEKVKSGKPPSLSAAHRQTPVGKKACGGHKGIILNKSCSQFVEIFSRGAELYTTMSGPS